MTRDDLKPGYVVKARNGKLLLVAEGTFGMCLVDRHLCAYSARYWMPDLRQCSPFIDSRNPFDIMEVYGLSATPSEVLCVCTDSRELLWKRSEPKKITVKEICEALGYDVEIVKEAPNA